MFYYVGGDITRAYGVLWKGCYTYALYALGSRRTCPRQARVGALRYRYYTC